MAPPRKSRPFATIRIDLEAVAEPPRWAAEGEAAETLAATDPFLAPITSSSEASGWATAGLAETRAAEADPIGASASTPPGSPPAAILDFSEIQSLAAKALKTNLEAQFAFADALLRTRSLSEAVVLQGAHFRRQYEDFTSQWKDLSAAALRLGAPKA